MTAKYTLRREGLPVHLGVQWTGDNFEAVRNALSWADIGIEYRDVTQDGETLRVHQDDPLMDMDVGVNYEMSPGEWLVWERGDSYTELVQDQDVRSLFPVIEPGDTEEIREWIAEDREDNTRFIEKLRALMLAHPDLPIEWIERSDGGAYAWMGGYQYSDLPRKLGVETIARGWRHHVIVKDETEATDMDDPDDPELEWYEAIVVRMG